MTKSDEPTEKSADLIELKPALLEARMAESDRVDATVGVSKAQQMRLDQLSELLQSVKSEIPADDERFSLAVLPGQTPRLWVDPTSYVMLSDDNRTYHFVKDTRSGRRAMADSTEAPVIAKAITRYVARRIVEREREIEADFIAGGVTEAAIQEEPRRRSGFWLGVFFGALLAAAGLFSWAWFGNPPDFSSLRPQ